jgi:hypothetical protein
MILFLASSPLAFAEKFIGYIWDKAAGALLVEGIPVEVTGGAKIERKNHPGITFEDLRLGWEVEVEGDRGRKASSPGKLRSSGSAMTNPRSMATRPIGPASAI